MITELIKVVQKFPMHVDGRLNCNIHVDHICKRLRLKGKMPRGKMH